MDNESSTNIHVSGGLLSTEFVGTARAEASANELFSPVAFTDSQGKPWTKKQLEEHLTNSWADFCERFDEVRLSLGRWEPEEARRKWTLPILDRFLGFDPKFVAGSERQKEAQKGPPKTSHRGWADPSAPPVHIVPPNQALDAKLGQGRGPRSPQDLLQQVLNVSGKKSWGVVTNGRSLRILRTYHHTYTQAYVDFDLESIFAERNFSDFRALLRTAHASRFRPGPGGRSPLETCYEESVTAGIRAGEDLRQNVRGAIEALGTGLLASRPKLAEDLSQDPAQCKGFYEELLRVVYRVLFLLFAEQRAMLPTRESVFAEEYSLTRLRQRAQGPGWSRDDNQDLWKGLLATFQLLKEGCPELKVYPYNGPLFDNELLPTISTLSCSNSSLLRAVRSMSFIEREGLLQRISYLDVGVEEIGAIYESLLDYTPRVLAHSETVDGVARQSREFVLDPAGGSRKTTGSYYTNRELVDALVRSALAPVAERALEEAGESKMAKERALLSLKVCDPACGSGAFLIAASNYLGALLATVRAGTENPDAQLMGKARREVLQNCIYAVDVNPMAVELAKVSLWIDSAVQDLPLNFLDHHIKAGNSLLGMTPSLSGRSVPPDAFRPISSDDKEVAKQTRKTASQEERQTTMDEHPEGVAMNEATALAGLSARPELTVAGVEGKRRVYAELLNSVDSQRARLAADAWTAAFFWPLDGSAPPAPTESVLRRLRGGTQAGSIDSATLAMIRTIASENCMFHWHLEFPDVFYRERPGFDCLLENPPWETIEVKEQEFFETKLPELAATTGAKRKKLIDNLKESHPTLYMEFQRASRSAEAQRKFAAYSGRFPLTARGRVNSYSLFSETTSQLTSVAGRAGLLVPTGIATDDNNKNFFGSLVERGQVISLIDFENSEALFESVHRSYKFCLLTLGNVGKECAGRFAFYLTNPSQMEEEGRFFDLGLDDFRLLNPNTRTSPLFRTKRDADLARGIYRRLPILLTKGNGLDPWRIRFSQGLFNMTSDSNLFKERPELETAGFRLMGSAFVKGGERYLPLYESKMMGAFDHRYGSFAGKADSSSSLPETPIESYQDPEFTVLPRYWVPESNTVAAAFGLSLAAFPPDGNGRLNPDTPFQPRWLLGFRDVACATNARTFIAAIVPFCGVGHNLPLLASAKPAPFVACLLANLQSFVLDFCVRQKAGGIHVAFYVVEQLPVLPPSAYSPELLGEVAAKVLELTYTSWDLQTFALDMGYVTRSGEPKQPFGWETGTRLRLRCELDAIFFHLYGLGRDDVDYVMETFPIVKKKDVETYGAYRTKEMVLAEYDRYDGKVVAYDITRDQALKVDTVVEGRKDEGSEP